MYGDLFAIVAPVLVTTAIGFGWARMATASTTSSGMPTSSMTTCAPRPSVSFFTAATRASMVGSSAALMVTSAPNSLAFFTFSVELVAEMMMTRLWGERFLTTLRTSMPFIPGIMMSRRIRSIFSCWTSFSTSRPSNMTLTPYPSSLRNPATVTQRSSSSSTISMRCCPIGLVHSPS